MTRLLHHSDLLDGGAVDTAVVHGAPRRYRLRGSLDVRSVRLTALLGAAWRSIRVQKSGYRFLTGGLRRG